VSGKYEKWKRKKRGVLNKREESIKIKKKIEFKRMK
jgi:hypothetical protein